jgi:predicted ribosome quality control (RQC) complex YloA/Tae2 family protein
MLLNKPQVDIDLTMTAYANVRKYHSGRKQTKQKTERTIAASEKVMKTVTKKAESDVKKIEREHQVHQLRQVRTLTWFETKFYWFFSSENLLCLQGKDYTTQDMLLKRYMDPNRDVVVGSAAEGSW